MGRRSDRLARTSRKSTRRVREARDFRLATEAGHPDLGRSAVHCGRVGGYRAAHRDLSRDGLSSRRRVARRGRDAVCPDARYGDTSGRRGAERHPRRRTHPFRHGARGGTDRRFLQLERRRDPLAAVRRCAPLADANGVAAGREGRDDEADVRGLSDPRLQPDVRHPRPGEPARDRRLRARPAVVAPARHRKREGARRQGPRIPRRHRPCETAVVGTRAARRRRRGNEEQRPGVLGSRRREPRTQPRARERTGHAARGPWRHRGRHLERKSGDSRAACHDRARSPARVHNRYGGRQARRPPECRPAARRQYNRGCRRNQGRARSGENRAAS